jgi:uncharacterized membrane protein YdjX (TVP38/TMEM64 family)
VPKVASGWLEEHTMSVLRARLVRRLRAADRHGRLAVMYPALPDGGFVNVHSKVLIADDRVVRIGSANLANRSMGLDTELDVAIESCGDARVEDAITRFRDDLVAEHLGCDPDRVHALVRRTGSLVLAIRTLAGGERTLRELDAAVPEWADDWLPEPGVLDPERPVGPAELIAAMLPELPAEGAPKGRFWRAAALIAAILGATALFQYGPFADAVTPEAVAAAAAPLRAAPFGPAAAAAAIAIASALLVPITALIVASGLLYGAALGAAVALAGALGSAALGYAAGRTLDRDSARRFLTPRLYRLARRIAERGFLAAAALRIVPVAPFAVVNLAAGALRLRFRDFALGTVVGMAPGVLVMTSLAEPLRRWVVDPGWRAGVILAGVAALVLLARRLLVRRVEASSAERPARAR